MRLIQVALRAEDLDRATAWYTDLLGHAPAAVYDPPGLVFFDLDGVRLLIEKGAEPATLYHAVDDIDAAVDDLEERGVRLLRYEGFATRDGDIHNFGDTRAVWFKDPAGNILNVGDVPM